MNKVMRHPHRRTLKELDAFVGSTWDSCFFPLKECLIRVEKCVTCLSLASLTNHCGREWDYFRTQEPCPYHSSADEIRQHQEEAENFSKSQELWKELRGILTDEGHASDESSSKAIEILKDLREDGIGDLKGEERQVFDRETQ
ncbi:hypothetical protein J1614_010436 [Plenodomus biglobosus]|nr:hypothetical protein J1614_010436 [Plenodomus biglobosus]